jgi:hypothetical protein
MYIHTITRRHNQVFLALVFDEMLFTLLQRRCDPLRVIINAKLRL